MPNYRSGYKIDMAIDGQNGHGYIQMKERPTIKQTTKHLLSTQQTGLVRVLRLPRNSVTYDRKVLLPRVAKKN